MPIFQQTIRVIYSKSFRIESVLVEKTNWYPFLWLTKQTTIQLLPRTSINFSWWKFYVVRGHRVYFYANTKCRPCTRNCDFYDKKFWHLNVHDSIRKLMFLVNFCSENFLFKSSCEVKYGFMLFPNIRKLFMCIIKGLKQVQTNG